MSICVSTPISKEIKRKNAAWASRRSGNSQARLHALIDADQRHLAALPDDNPRKQISVAPILSDQISGRTKS